MHALCDELQVLMVHLQSKAQGRTSSHIRVKPSVTVVLNWDMEFWLTYSRSHMLMPRMLCQQGAGTRGHAGAGATSAGAHTLLLVCTQATAAGKADSRPCQPSFTATHRQYAYTKPTPAAE